MYNDFDSVTPLHTFLEYFPFWQDFIFRSFFVEQILLKPAIVYMVDAPQFFVSCFKSLEHVW